MSVRNEEVAIHLGTKTHELSEMEKIPKKKKSAICVHIYINSRTPTQNKLVKRTRMVDFHSITN